jgi:hypothetical protein
MLPSGPVLGFGMDVARRRIVSVARTSYPTSLKAAIEHRIAKPNKWLRKA